MDCGGGIWCWAGWFGGWWVVAEVAAGLSTEGSKARDPGGGNYVGGLPSSVHHGAGQTGIASVVRRWWTLGPRLAAPAKMRQPVAELPSLPIKELALGRDGGQTAGTTGG